MKMLTDTNTQVDGVLQVNHDKLHGLTALASRVISIVVYQSGDDMLKAPSNERELEVFNDNVDQIAANSIREKLIGA